MQKRAFTLIELLVVIAIIAILAAIVLISLSSARTRANDARATSDMNQIRSRAEILNSENGNYSRVACTGGDSEIATLCTDINSMVPGTITIRNSGTAYCASVTLNNGDVWCVDSALYSNKASSCSATTYNCVP